MTLPLFISCCLLYLVVCEPDVSRSGQGPLFLNAATAHSNLTLDSQCANGGLPPAPAARDGASLSLVCSDHWFWKSCAPTKAKPVCKQLVCSDQWKWKSIAPAPKKEEPCKALVCSDHYLKSMKYPRRSSIAPSDVRSPCRQMVCADHWFFKVAAPTITARLRDQLFADVALWGEDSLSCDSEVSPPKPAVLPYVPVPSECSTPWPVNEQQFWADVDLWSHSKSLPQPVEEDAWDEEDTEPIVISWPRRMNASDYKANATHLGTVTSSFPIPFELSSAHDAWIINA